MKQLIYQSQPFGFDEAMLAGILLQARRNNQRDAITGALICRQDLYVQLIEGPDDAIDKLYAKIAVDDRHCDVRLLLSDMVDGRLFAEWDMLDDTNPTLIWSSQEVRDGSLDTASPGALRAVFGRIAATSRIAFR